MLLVREKTRSGKKKKKGLKKWKSTECLNCNKLFSKNRCIVPVYLLLNMEAHFCHIKKKLVFVKS